MIGHDTEESPENCHSHSSEKPSANTGVKNSKMSIIIMIIIIIIIIISECSKLAQKE